LHLLPKQVKRFIEPYFFALTGADDERTIHQIVFVSATNTDGQLNEHSLLISGHFDQPHVFKSAAEGGAAVTDYRSVPILVIQLLAREQGTLHDVRWLAILDSRVLVFGTIASTRLELDRYLEHSRTDEALLRRLAHLRSKDQTWCVLSAPVKNLSLPTWRQEIYAVLAMLNPELADLGWVGTSLEAVRILCSSPLVEPAARNSRNGLHRLHSREGDLCLPRDPVQFC
jgi:hypothetical protein